MMNTKIYYLFIFLLGVINTPLIGQEKDDDDDDHDHADFYCGDTIHGIPNLPLLIEECEQTTFITSLQEDGTAGTIVFGALEATQIKITPGHSFVKIIPDPSEATRRHTRTRFRRRNRGRSVKLSNVISTEAISIKKEEDKGTENISVFPNPFRDVLQMTSQAHPIVAYQIQDLYGKTIQQKTIKATYKQVISVSELQKGMYILSLYFQNGIQQQQRIIKH